MQHVAFPRKLNEFRSLIEYAASRYEIPGILDRDDLYQEGLTILHGMFSWYSFDPDSDDFRKLFKTELWHGLCKLVDRYKTEGRDYRKALSENQSSDEGSFSIFDQISSSSLEPEAALIEAEQQHESDMFFQDLIDELDADCRAVLAILCDRDLLDPKALEGYARLPSCVTIPMIQRQFDWSLPRATSTLQRLKDHVINVSVLYGLL